MEFINQNSYTLPLYKQDQLPQSHLSVPREIGNIIIEVIKDLGVYLILTIPRIALGAKFSNITFSLIQDLIGSVEFLGHAVYTMNQRLGWNLTFALTIFKLCLMASLFFSLDFVKKNSFNAHICFNILTITNTFINSCEVLCHAKGRLKSSWQSQERYKCTALLITGLVLSALAIFGLYSVICTAWKLKNAYLFARSLAPSQLEELLKQQPFLSLGQKKDCTAVIIDGIPFHQKDIPNPTGDFIREICDTRVYTVKSDNEVISALSDASGYFKKPIDVLALEGHADPELMTLGQGYEFKPEHRLSKAMNTYLAPKGQVLVVGCNTATITHNTPIPLAQKVSQSVPGRFVTGFAGYFGPGWSTHWYKRGFFHIQNHTPVKSGQLEGEWSWTFPFNAVIYQNGTQV